MKKIPVTTLRTHVQNYIRATLADQLLNAGFVSRKDNACCWYRVQGNAVAQSIYFFTHFSDLPTFLEIGFGCHPLFLTPVFPNNPLMRDLPGNEILYPRYVLMDRSNKHCYSDDILISCPEDEQYGGKLIDAIIAVLNAVTSPQDCYELHKQWRQREIENNSWINVSTHFVDEVIFWDDRELYPFCENYVSRRSTLLDNALKKNPQSAKYRKELDYLQLLDHVMTSEDRALHDQLLAERRLETIHQLRKYVGIDITCLEA